MATDHRQVRAGLATLVVRTAPFVVVGAIALALDEAFCLASGGWSFLGTFLFPLWAFAFLSALAALYASLAVVPPLVVSFFVVAASALARLASGKRRVGRPPLGI